jgi:serine protease
MSRNSLPGRLSAVLAAASLVGMAACSDVPSTSVSSLDPTTAAFSKSDAGDPVVAGEVIVKLRDGESIQSLRARHGVGAGAVGYAHAFDIVMVGKGNERAMAARLAADPAVEYAEPNYIRQVDAIDSRLWAFYNPGGLNMRFNEPGAARDGTLLPSTYASKADADEDNIEGYAAGGA